MSIDPSVREWFNSMDTNRIGKISCKDFQNALNSQGHNFSDRAIDLMVSLINPTNSHTIDLHQFNQLYTFINSWIASFTSYDFDKSGYLEEDELMMVFTNLGYNLSSDFIKNLIYTKDYMNHKGISLDQFIILCVQIYKLSEAFKRRDADRTGVITLGFEEFLNLALINT